MTRDREAELARAREALERGFPEEAIERLEPWPDDPEAEDLRRQARTRRPRPMLPPTDAQLAARRRAMRAVVFVTVLTAITGLVAAALIGLTT